MKAPPFAYARARTLKEALDFLRKHGERAKILAGGQSLLATLNMRLSSSELLIDISRLSGLTGVKVGKGTMTISAVMNAINDALAPFNARVTAQLFTPERIMRALGKI